MDWLLADCLGVPLLQYWNLFLSPFLGQLPGTQPLIFIKQRAFRMMKQLGEGGYAFVYLVKEVPSPGQTTAVDVHREYALKKVLAGSQEALSSAEREATIQQAVAHPCILPLLDWAVVPPSAATSACHTVYMLSPAYPDGTLADELVRLGTARTHAHAAQGKAASQPVPGSMSGVVGCVFSTHQVLRIWQQLCSALAALHDKGYAHRDVKVHNILIRRASSGSQQPSKVATRQGGYQALQGTEERCTAGMGSNQGTSASGVDVEAGLELGHTCGDYTAVLMDLGSARQRHVVLNTRMEALQLQEDAEANCTATFRSPELWDAPSPATLDQAPADIWAAGCTLYAIMYGQSPFQVTLNQGGSLALAVMNGVAGVAWPKDPAATYPAQLHDLVIRCLAVHPQERPTAAQLVGELAALLASHPRFPDPPVFTQSCMQDD